MFCLAIETTKIFCQPKIRTGDPFLAADALSHRRGTILCPTARSTILCPTARSTILYQGIRALFGHNDASSGAALTEVQSLTQQETTLRKFCGASVEFDSAIQMMRHTSGRLAEILEWDLQRIHCLETLSLTSV